MSVASEPSGLAACEHEVCFYATDSELERVVVDYLLEGLSDGAGAVVIATLDHRQHFERGLAESGLDVDGAVDAGRLRWLDAETTLARVYPDGRFDETGFRGEIVSVAREVTASLRTETGSSSLLAFGELVNLLWERGEAEKALELEWLWNEVIEELGVSLLCGYRTDSPANVHDDPVLQEVCRLHSSVCAVSAPADPQLQEQEAGPIEVSEEREPAVMEVSEEREPAAMEISRHFPAELNAPRAARRFLEATLREWEHESATVADALIVLSELVTNAVVHAGSSVAVSVRSHQARVRLAVRDESTLHPVLRTPAVDAASGRGLHLIAALSRRWGVEVADDGKVVWAEI